MRFVGIDLHKRFLVVAVEDERGRPRKPRRFDCRETEEIREYFKGLGRFAAVIEASSSYRWLYELLEPLGNVILALSFAKTRRARDHWSFQRGGRGAPAIITT